MKKSSKFKLFICLYALSLIFSLFTKKYRFNELFDSKNTSYIISSDFSEDYDEEIKLLLSRGESWFYETYPNYNNEEKIAISAMVTLYLEDEVIDKKILLCESLNDISISKETVYKEIDTILFTYNDHLKSLRENLIFDIIFNSTTSTILIYSLIIAMKEYHNS